MIPEDVEKWLSVLAATEDEPSSEERRELRDIMNRPVMAKLWAEIGRKAQGRREGMMALNFFEPSGARLGCEAQGYVKAVVDFAEMTREMMNEPS